MPAAAAPASQGEAGRTDARAVAGDPDPQRLRPDSAAHRRRHHHRLAVDADRDLRHVDVHHHLPGGERGQALTARAAQKLNGLQCAAHCHRDDAERAGVQPGPVAEPGDVVQLVRAVELTVVVRWLPDLSVRYGTCMARQRALAARTVGGIGTQGALPDPEDRRRR
jgi:hypothetical protein